MKVKIIPETEAEKAKFETKTYEGLKDFFFCGRSVDADNTAVEVHEWRGALSYLIGSLHYYGEIINDERRVKQVNDSNRRVQAQVNREPVKMVRHSTPTESELQVVDTDIGPVSANVKKGTGKITNINDLGDEELQRILNDLASKKDQK